MKLDELTPAIARGLGLELMEGEQLYFGTRICRSFGLKPHQTENMKGEGLLRKRGADLPQVLQDSDFL